MPTLSATPESRSTVTRRSTIRIEAPVGACLEVLTAFGEYPRWQSAVRSADVLRQTTTSARVGFAVNVVVKRIHYVLDYAIGPGGLTWTYVSGDLRDVSGSYQLTVDGSGTLATYTVGIDPGRLARGPLRGALEAGATRAMQLCVEELKHRCEHGPPPG